MTAGDLLMTRKDGPLSVIFPVQVTSIMRALPLASQGLASVASPVEPAGQSCTGPLALAVGAGAVAEGAGAADSAGGAALCALGAVDGLFSSEQPTRDRATAAAVNAFEIGVVLDMAGSRYRMRGWVGMGFVTRPRMANNI